MSVEHLKLFKEITKYFSENSYTQQDKNSLALIRRSDILVEVTFCIWDVFVLYATYLSTKSQCLQIYIITTCIMSVNSTV